MKKKTALLLSAVLVVSGFLMGCSTGGTATTETKEPETKVETPAPAPAEAKGGLKTGLALTTGTAKSKDAGEKDGNAQADVTIVAVTVDADGRVVDCVIDAAQTKIAFSKDGKILTDFNTEFKTKNELKEGYGMVKASSIGKEWYQQAEVLADYFVGKTAAEIKGIAVTEEGVPTEAALTSSVTIKIGGYQETVVKAIENAKDLGAQAGDKLGVGVTTNIKKSKYATADADGLAQAYTTVSAVTVGKDGKITSSVIDAVQANINFDATGKVTSDITAASPSKNELGDSYGMRGASSIGKEWFEQADAFAKYAVGKTADEVNATPVKEGVPSEADLASSVTVHITDFNTVITKAVANAR